VLVRRGGRRRALSARLQAACACPMAAARPSLITPDGGPERLALAAVGDLAPASVAAAASMPVARHQLGS
jgi:hypothetical protein